jgi:hypothetical protein
MACIEEVEYCQYVGFCLRTVSVECSTDGALCCRISCLSSMATTTVSTVKIVARNTFVVCQRDLKALGVSS